MATVEEFLVQLDASTEGLRREMKRASRQTQKTQKSIDGSLKRVEASFKRTTRAAANFSRSLKVVAGAALAVASGRALGGLVRGGLEATRTLTEMAKVIGITTQELQELRFMGAQVGISTKTTDAAIQRLSRRMGEAAEGSGLLLGILQDYNIALRDEDGNIRSVTAVLDGLATATQNAASQQERLIIANRAFDIEGTKFVNVLIRGTRGMAAWAAEARRMGLVWNDDMIAQAEAATIALTQQDLALSNLRQRMAIALGPTITWMADRLASLVDWAVRAKKAIRELVGMPIPDTPASQLIDTPAAGAPGAGGGAAARESGFAGAEEVLINQNRQLERQLELLHLEGAELAKRQAQYELWDQRARSGLELTDLEAAALGAQIDQRDRLIERLQAEKDLIEEIDAEIEAEEEARQQADDAAADAAGRREAAMETLGDSIAGVVTTTQTWRDALMDITRRVLPALIKKLLEAAAIQVLGGGGGAGGGGLTRFLDTALGGKGVLPTPMAAGGSFGAGQPLRVGERGPELMVPTTPGVIVPNNALGPRISISQSLSFGGTDPGGSVQAQIAAALPMIQRSTVAAVSDAVLRGGAPARAVGRLGRRR